MTREKADERAIELVKELIRAKQLKDSGSTDPKEVASYWAAQIQALHAQLTAYFFKFDIDKK
jgi:hypothetical protein